MPAGRWGIAPFFAERGSPFDFGAPTTALNAMRVLRALQLPKAALLEGSPGVGKTSLVAALARALGAMRMRSADVMCCSHSLKACPLAQDVADSGTVAC
jgi:midasin